jgi:anti-anti-sigma regulatory factor
MGGFMSQAEAIKTGFSGECRVVSMTPKSLQATGAVAECMGVLAELGQQTSADGLVPSLFVDMSEIDRITSEGLNELIGLNSEARAQGVTVQLLDVCPSVRDVFKLTRLERMFEFGTVASMD